MRTSDSERGATLIMVALTLSLLVSFLALAVDVGVGYVERRRIQAVADAAALAGVQVLVNNLPDSRIISTVQEYALVRNPLGANETRTVTVHWMRGNTVLDQQVGSGARPTGVTGIQVTVRGNAPTFFAGVLGITEVNAQAEGGGGYSPLDLMLVIDRSISMEFYSCNWERYFDIGQPCRGLLDSVTPEWERIMNVYYSCGGNDGDTSNDCRGIWRRPSLFQPYACYWPNNARMSAVPAECASAGLNIATQAGCQACKGAIVEPKQPITDARAAANLFVDLVKAELDPTDPRVGLSTYSDRGTLNVGLTVDEQFNSVVKPAISAITPGGNTNCEEGLYLARAELTSHARATAVKAIVFMTDGRANLYRGCYNRGSCSESTARSRTISEARTAQNNGIRVYAIGLGDGADQTMLQQLVDDPDGPYDGVYLFAPTGADLAAAYASMFAEIKRLRLVE